MTLDWAAVSTIVDIIGILIVVATLFFLGAQVRQNTNAMLANSRQSLLDGDLELISEYMSFSVDPHLIRDDVELTLEDERRFVWLLVKAIRIREFAWHQYKAGSLDEKTWQSYMAPVGEMFSTNRAKSVLQFYSGSPEFAVVLTDWLRAAEESSPGGVRQATLDLLQGFTSNPSAKTRGANE